MKIVTCLMVLMASRLWAQPTVSGFTVDNISHGSARATWSASDGIGSYYVRVRVSTSSCTGGSGGNAYYSGSLQLASHGLSFSGLAESTVYNVCLETSTVSDFSSNVNNNVANTSFTTSAKPSGWPVAPTSPTTFDTAYPDTTGYNTAVLDSTCSNWTSVWSTAATNQATQGTVITMPAAGCTGSFIVPASATKKSFTSSNVNTTNNTIGIEAHGYPEGQAIRFGNNACLPNSSGTVGGSPDCRFNGGIYPGHIWYVRNPNADDFQISSTVSGSILDLTSAGTGTNYVDKVYTPSDKWIILRTPTADGAFCPEGTRCVGSVWGSKMAKLQLGTQAGTTLQLDILAHNVRIVGIDFTHGDASAEALTTYDPRPWNAYIDTGWMHTSNFILDRCWIRGLGAPNRLYRPITTFDGTNMAIIDSDLDQWDFWKPGKTGHVPSHASNVVTFTAGSIKTGVRTTTQASSFTVTLSGTPSGASTAYIYYDIDGVLTAKIPTGMSASSSITINTSTGATLLTNSCNITGLIAQGAIPVDGNSRTTGMPLACVSINASGTVTAVVEADTHGSSSASEGSQGLIAGRGPGPFIIRNNRIEATGIPIHFDDSGADAHSGSSYSIEQNLFYTNPARMFGGASSDGYRYGHRQPLEWKNGTLISVKGNIFDGNFSENTPASVFIAHTPREGGNSGDVEIAYNTFQSGQGGINVCQAIDGNNSRPQSPPCKRVWIHDNLFTDIDGWTYKSTVGATGNGWLFYGGYGSEDVVIEHNTAYLNRGDAEVPVYWVQNPTAGLFIRNNILFFNQFSSGGFTSNNVQAPATNLTGKAALDKIGQPDYSFTKNVIIPGPADSEANTGQMSASTISTDLDDLAASNFIRDDASVAASITAMKWYSTTDSNFRLRHDSPYITSATTGRAVGADIRALEAEQGKVTNERVLSIGSTSATVHFMAPDTTGCTVDWYTSDPLSFTRVSNAGGSRIQSVNLTGLSSKTIYTARINCAVEQPTVQFRTN